MGTKIDRRRVLLGISAAMGGVLSPAAVKALDAAQTADEPTGFQKPECRSAKNAAGRD